MMGKTIVADIGDEVLSFKTEYSDRFVYSNYFVPVLLTFDDDTTPILPFYVKAKLLELIRSSLIDLDRLESVLRQLGYAELWTRNNMAEANTRFMSTATMERDEIENSRPGRELGDIGRSVRDASQLLEALTSRLQPQDRELLAVVSRQLFALTQPLMDASVDVRSTAFPSPVARRPTVLGQQVSEFINGLLQPDIGIVFLDRTRIRPVGFAAGEHVYALSLAPGEEVTLEQRTFSKRQVTFEEQSDQEQQFDIELSSTYSTELQEGLERQRSLTDSLGLNLSHTGQYTSPEKLPWGQINASHTIGYTRNVTDANQETARRSVKDGQTASSKVSAKYRTQHKLTFRIVSEEGFEATSKRTIRNPNRTTPITLHYFKVLQRVQMLQERYGVRLCWAPSIKDPALTFQAKVRNGRKHIIDTALRSLPTPPIEPVPPAPSGAQTTTTRETVTRSSPVTVADKWGVSGDMRANYDVDIEYDTGYSWDGKVDDVEASIQIFSRRENVSRSIVGIPRPVPGEGLNKLRVVVHIGTGSWLGGPGISFQVSATFYKDVTITQQASTDTKYNEDMAAYRIALQEWTDQRDRVLASAYEAANAFEQRMIDGLSPVNEMISQIIESIFDKTVRDEMWEIDYWQRLFDWERASFIAYPSWWSGVEARNPVLDPSDFMNASWAKLYLPIRLGMERDALRWIFGKSIRVPLAAEVEGRFDVLINDLKQFRQNIIGAIDEVVDLVAECQEAPEQYRCMASWHELIPTDGTHIEIIQGITSAADSITDQEIADATELRKALLDSEKQSAKLKDKAYEQMTQPATIEVNVGTSDGPRE